MSLTELALGRNGKATAHGLKSIRGTNILFVYIYTLKKIIINNATFKEKKFKFSKL